MLIIRLSINSEYGPTFGGGHDIIIRDKSNLKENCTSSLNSHVCPVPEQG